LKQRSTDDILTTTAHHSSSATVLGNGQGMPTSLLTATAIIVRTTAAISAIALLLLPQEAVHLM
jgi:hypothetical protein